jgi:hypothetical protein
MLIHKALIVLLWNLLKGYTEFIHVSPSFSSRMSVDSKDRSILSHKMVQYREMVNLIEHYKGPIQFVRL